MGRALLRFGALATAAVLTVGGPATAAHAQETGSSAPVPTTTAPPSTTVPPSTSDAAPPTSSQPSTTEAPVTTTTPPSVPSTTTPPSSTPPTTTPPSTTPPSSNPPSAPKPDLKASVRLDKSEYQSHEQVRLTLTVTNNGSVVAEGVKASVWGVSVGYLGWGDFDWSGPGARIEPGQSRTVEAVGRIQTVQNGEVGVSGSVAVAGGDANQQDNYFYAKAKVTQTYGALTGVVYADRNHNGQVDAGEALADGVVSTYGGSPSESHETTTDANGRFTFPKVSAGLRTVQYSLPGGWVVHYDGGAFEHEVAPGGTTELLTRAERPYSESLKATGSLDKDVYAFGETAVITVTLTNIDSRPIKGITAACGRSGEGHSLHSGPEWGDLADTGKGVELAAGETRTFVIRQAVPAGARGYGRVYLNCDFSPYAGWNGDGPVISDNARVTGGVGNVQAKLAHDRNNNWTVDADEAIGGVRVTFVEQGSRKRVAYAISGADGQLDFTGVPVGEYEVFVDGPYRFKGGAGLDQIHVREWGVNTSFFVEPAKHDLKVTAAFDQSEYTDGAQAKIKVSITNHGTAAARTVRVLEPKDEEYLKQRPVIDEPGWSEFDDLPTVTDTPLIAPGETVDVNLTAKAAGSLMRLKGTIVGDDNMADNTFDVSAKVVSGGTVNGFVFGDADRDGKAGVGEALANVRAHFLVQSGQAVEALTDAQGRFSVKLPAGEYTVYYTGPDGWLVKFPSWRDSIETVKVESGQELVLERRAVRPVRNVLDAEITLDQPSYRPGDTAKVTVTLKNTSATELRNISAQCAENTNDSWGDLRTGVRVPAGGELTFHPSEIVPDDKQGTGRFFVTCVFGDITTDPFEGMKMAWDGARLLGAVGELKGSAVDVDAQDAPVAGAELLVVDPFTGDQVATVTTDLEGRFSLTELPAGPYLVKASGRWADANDEPTAVDVVRDGASDHVVRLKAKPAEPAEPAQPGPEGGKAAPASPKVVLAKTGASVLGLGVVALLLVAFGIGARTAARRKTA